MLAKKRGGESKQITDEEKLRLCINADISSNMQTNTFAKVYLFAKKIGGKQTNQRWGKS